MCLAKSILLGQVGATCCAATFFIKSMTSALAILLGKASTPKMVALGATAMSATQPIPIFCGSVVTSIKGAAIHDEGGLMRRGLCVCCQCAWIAKHRHQNSLHAHKYQLAM